ncbi:MAG: molybdopterin-dependent oxidoreductase [Planctomycetota bacterium]|nr:molybdopterin-dependent oxidoreductase [Planctomycetota bacterium]
MSDDKKPDAKPAAPAAPAAPPPKPEPAIKLPKAPEGQMTLRVDGTDHFIDPKKYRVLIEALHDLGYGVPNFCYHPGLEPDGNCRICYVNLIDVMSGKPMAGPNLSTQPWSMYPKPTISCRQPLDPRGMVVDTSSPAVVEARKWVMEFLLINHPLDCFVCDKAGECMLQNHSFDHGQADSRFQEAKNEKAPKELGPTIKLWTDRCIVCTRCTRFLDEVSGTSELYVTQRGDRSEIDIMAGHPVENEMMGNIVDICPVGCLIDKDLMFTYRAWYLQHTDTVCPSCSKGCNIKVDAQKNYVRRLQPRENREVNGFWMCDRGRKDFRYVNADTRVMQGRLGGQPAPVIAACDEAGKRLSAAATQDPASVAGLCSAWLTLEELHVFKTLFVDVLKTLQVGLLAQADWEPKEFPKFKIEADRNPNAAGAALVFGPEAAANTAKILEAARAGKLKVLYLAASMPHFEPPAELLEALAKVETVIVQDLSHGALAEKAAILLPGSSFAEKDGVFVNAAKRAQVLRRAIDPLGQGNDDLAVLQRVARAAGAGDEWGRLRSARVVFQQMAGAYPALAGMTHQSLGRQGAALNAAEPAASTGAE